MKSTLERIQNEQQYFCAHSNFIFMGMWKSNERARPCLSAGRQKTPLVVMSYLKAQWLVHSFIPDIFKVLTFSKRLLAPPLSPPPPRQEFGGSPTPTGRQQIHCATALGTLHLTLRGGSLCSNAVPLTGHYSQINMALPGPDIVPQHTARMLTNFYLCLFHFPSPG